MKELVYFAICLACTMMGSISGIGGGVLIKPILDAVSGMDASTISFLSGLTVAAMALVSMVQHFAKQQQERLDPKRGTLLAAGSIAGGMLGKALFSALRAAIGQDALLTRAQNLLLLFLTLLVFLYYLRKASITTHNVENPWACFAAGLALGLLSSFLGIGGGPINLMVLSYFFGMDTKTAALHSLYIILLSQTASLATTFAGSAVPPFDPWALVAMVLGGVLGAFAGRSLNRRLNQRGVERLFMGMLVAIMGLCIYNIC